MTVACALAGSQMANATLSISGSVGGAPSGVNKVNFDDLTPGSSLAATATGPNGSVGVSFTPDGQVAQNSSYGVYAAPWLSGGNGNGFAAGNLNQLNGVDTTPYLTTGKGKVTLSFSSAQMYLGLLWGSVDTYNTLSFYSGGINGTPVGSVTGVNVVASPNGNQGQQGTLYVNINSTLPFDTVVASSSAYAFEFDNVAYNTTQVVPEPTTVLAGALLLLPFGASTIRNLRRKA